VSTNKGEFVGAFEQNSGNVRSTNATSGNPDQRVCGFDLWLGNLFDTNISRAMENSGSH
jgi:hypothetical protein